MAIALANEDSASGYRFVGAVAAMWWWSRSPAPPAPFVVTVEFDERATDFVPEVALQQIRSAVDTALESWQNPDVPPSHRLTLRASAYPSDSLGGLEWIFEIFQIGREAAVMTGAVRSDRIRSFGSGDSGPPPRRDLGGKSPLELTGVHPLRAVNVKGQARALIQLILQHPRRDKRYDKTAYRNARTAPDDRSQHLNRPGTKRHPDPRRKPGKKPTTVPPQLARALSERFES